MVALLLLIVALAVGCLAYLTGAQKRDGSSADSARISARHQIYGDPAIMESFERGDFSKVLFRKGDQMLAWFAEPGRLMCPQGNDVRRPRPELFSAFGAYAETELTCDKDLVIALGELREYRELMQIVNGMRKEMRAYLANGNGTVKSYWRRLVQRTSEEMQIFERTRRELENEKSPQVWERKNSALCQIGLRTIPNKKETED